MFSRHVSPLLAPYLDDELSPRAQQRVESHLAECDRCRTERDQVQFGMTVLEHLPEAQAPDAIWASIEAALPRDRPPAFQSWRFALAGLAIFLVVAAFWWTRVRHPETRWEVVRIYGVPSIGAKAVRGVARIGAGEWIETNSSSSAMVKVGEIGSVDIAPNTRLRVVTAAAGEHRLALERGEIRAKISAPPRLFFVNTASGTAVDLGCEYTLHTDEDGSGLLQVTRGWVEFQGKGPDSLIPAGASCRTHATTGPGIPYFDDAPQKLRQALEELSTEKSSGSALDTILAEARVRDTLTLWHLLSRVALPDRGRIYDRMAALTPVPAGVSRQDVLKLDPATLTRWKDELAWTW